ncbi:Ankyrin repeat-containing domain protein [Niveomyces insectorum RCEF 264]|uniref:Ankyrin repeat-containing domain protein n=1 Tax=Niveomyces insectorum RCEF 264 TaxID=1081102 RepID=A0A167PRJ3_9HYPO|nr:Ankyrin repeat-containing domain protein [Niveomyces insectorum RCEF 264]
MASPPSAAVRQQRLAALAQEFGLPPFPPLSALTKPLQPLSLRTPSDDAAAEELLKARRLAATASASAGNTTATGDNRRSATPASSLKRAFTSARRRDWQPHELFAALHDHVDQAGSAGVAEALIAKLLAAGGDVNGTTTVTKTKTASSRLSRRRSVESFERSRLLQRAIQHGNYELVAVLVPHADPPALDAGLPHAIRAGRADLVELLLCYGAQPAHTPAGVEAFREVCAAGGRPDLLGLLLAAAARDDKASLSHALPPALLDATATGCIESVMLLSRYAAAAVAAVDGNYNNAAALRTTILACRVDLVLALVAGAAAAAAVAPVTAPPPSSAPLNAAFQLLFTHPSILPNDKMALAEILLCAGASGDVVAAALLQACRSNVSAMVGLLADYGASVEYDQAAVLRHVLAQKKLSLARILLLSENIAVSPRRASACLTYLPKDLSHAERYGFLDLLLRRGAGGTPLHDMLIEVTEAGDVASARLLLTPQFPLDDANHPNPDYHPRSASPAHIERRASHHHHLASVDYKEGMALQLAVQTGQLDIVELMLATRPSPDILAEVFPNIVNLPPTLRYQTVERFLATGFAGPCVTAALQQALLEPPATRDERLVALLLRSKADINAAGGAGLRSAVAQRDLALLQTILRNSHPAPPVLATALTEALAVTVDPDNRRAMVLALVGTGVHQDKAAVAEALLTALRMQPIDVALVDGLLKQGQADINYHSGLAVVLAAAHLDPTVLTRLLETQRADADTVRRALYALSGIPSNTTKATKLASLLRYIDADVGDVLSDLLVSEVQLVVRAPSAERCLSVVQALLAAGADVNAHQAAALCYAVAAPVPPLVDMFLQSSRAQPPQSSLTPASLAAAIPRIFNITDVTERFALATLLLGAGVPAYEASRALNHAVVTVPDDLPLLQILAAAADPADGSALFSAVQHRSRDALATLLASRSFAVPVINGALAEAVTIDGSTDRETRQALCALLLAAGATDPAVSDALVAAAAAADLPLGRLLLEHGARVDHQNGQALLRACRAGAADVLQMLLEKQPPSAPPEEADLMRRGFHEAEHVDDLGAREAIFRLLLDKGTVGGEALDRQLLCSVRCGDDGAGLVRLLLAHGANANYEGGEALWTCTRNGCIPILKLLLGSDVDGDDDASTVDENRHKHKPSQETMERALKASWMLSAALRYQVVQSLVAAGLQATEAVHIALNKAVNDDYATGTTPAASETDDHDDKDAHKQDTYALVRLLLDHGASPLANGCQTLVDAACRCRHAILALCIAQSRVPVPAADLAYVFAHAFTSERVTAWFSEEGRATAELLLEQGAQNPDDLARVLVLAIEHDSTGRDADALAGDFVRLFVRHQANVDLDRGLPLQAAAKRARVDYVRPLLSRQPSADSLAMALPYIFMADAPENEVLSLLSLFCEYARDSPDGGLLLDVMFKHPDCAPVVFVALSRYPRSVAILEALLDAGYYHDQMTTARVDLEEAQSGDDDNNDNDDEERVSLLLWALLQPQKKIGSALLELLVARGAKVNFETARTKTTPLMLAIRTKRPDVVTLLLQAGADVDVADHRGHTPLFLAACASGGGGGSSNDTGLAMLADVLAAGPSVNDGSLHVAARNLNVAAMKLLVAHGHEVDFPSPHHAGRSALAELCLYGSSDDALPLSAARLKDLNQSVAYLLSQGSDVRLRSEGKTPLLLALEAHDPVATTQALLKAGLYKTVNDPCNQYSDNTYTYSPTMYVAHVRPWSSSSSSSLTDVRERLLAVLRTSRAEDVFYAHTGPQPVGATGMPDELLRAERDARQVGTAQQLSRITLNERRSLDTLEQAQNRRELARLAEGRNLAHALGQLPPAHGPNGGNRNVAGYIMGEIK